MDQTTATSVFDKLLDPLADSFTPEMAMVIAEFRADDNTQARVDELAEKCNDGSLTDSEKQEYESFVEASTLIAVLKVKARRVLENPNA